MINKIPEAFKARRRQTKSYRAFQKGNGLVIELNPVIVLNKEKVMLIAVRAEVEDVHAWREGFKTHGDLFKSQGVSIAYMGATEGNSVIAVFDTNDVDAFMKVFNDPATAEAMANDKISGGVELFVLDETFTP